MRTPHAPRAVSGPKSVSIEGCLLAFDRHAEQWVLLGMEGSDVLHLPVFSSDEKIAVRYAARQNLNFILRFNAVAKFPFALTHFIGGRRPRIRPRRSLR